MKKLSYRLLSPLVAVVILLLLAPFCGCEKKKAGYSRSNDEAYINSLKATIDKRNQTAIARSRINQQIEQFRGRARKALPKDASDAQIRAELDGNPAKYPGWKEISEAAVKMTAREEQEQAEAAALVRRRLMKESEGARPAGK